MTTMKECSGRIIGKEEWKGEGCFCPFISCLTFRKSILVAIWWLLSDSGGSMSIADLRVGKSNMVGWREGIS